ncbi:hypothetical protein Tco_1371305 [Tanacetum coccineum]
MPTGNVKPESVAEVIKVEQVDELRALIIATNGRRIEDVGTSHTEPEGLFDENPASGSAVGVVHREDVSGSKINIRSRATSTSSCVRASFNNFFELDAAVVKSSVIHKAISHLRVGVGLILVAQLLFRVGVADYYFLALLTWMLHVAKAFIDIGWIISYPNGSDETFGKDVGFVSLFTVIDLYVKLLSEPLATLPTWNYTGHFGPTYFLGFLSRATDCLLTTQGIGRGGEEAGGKGWWEELFPKLNYLTNGPDETFGN